MSYLLDTNVVSEIRKPIKDANVAAWFEQADSAGLYVSVLIVGEVRQGIERLLRRGDQRQAAIFEAWLTMLKEQFADRVLPVSIGVAERWGRLNATHPVPLVDGLMAATAMEHDLTFVTRESGSLAATGARLLNPWQ